MFAPLECVCEPTLSHQTGLIKPLQKCGPYMPMAVLIRDIQGFSIPDSDTIHQSWADANVFASSRLRVPDAKAF